MAIPPNRGKEEQPVEEYKVASSSTGAPVYVPTPINAGPKPLKLEKYRRRQQRKLEEKLTAVPPVQRPRHRRGGQLVRMRRKLAALRRSVESDPPLPWERAAEIWQEIHDLESKMEERRRR